MNTNLNPGHATGVNLCLLYMISAVNQAKAINLPAAFICIGALYSQKRILLRTAASPPAPNALQPLLQRSDNHASLPCPGAGQLY